MDISKLRPYLALSNRETLPGKRAENFYDTQQAIHAHRFPSFYTFSTCPPTRAAARIISAITAHPIFNVSIFLKVSSFKSKLLSACALLVKYEQELADAQAAHKNAESALAEHVGRFCVLCPFQPGDIIMRDLNGTTTMAQVTVLDRVDLTDGHIRYVLHIDWPTGAGAWRANEYRKMLAINIMEIPSWTLFRKGPDGQYIMSSLKDWEVPNA